MGVSIAVESGSRKGSTTVLNDEVARVGSDAKSDIVVPEMPPHGLTVVRDGRSWMVINRACERVVLGGRLVAQQEPRRWRVGQRMRIGADVLLRLTNQEPEPFDEVLTLDNTLSELNDAEERVASNKVVPLLVALVIGLVLNVGVAANHRHDETVTQRFSRIMSDADKRIDGDSRMKEAVFLLGRARWEEHWNSPEAASKFYLRVRSVLNRNREESRGVDDLEANIRNFVDNRLERIGI